MEKSKEEHGKEGAERAEDLAGIPVSAIMTAEPATVREQASVRAAVQIVIEKKIAGLPVVNDHGTLVGVVSENDLLLMAASGRMSHALQHTQNPDFVTPDMTLKEALVKMIRQKRKWFPVVDTAQKVVGVLARSDLLRVLLEKEQG